MSKPRITPLAQILRLCDGLSDNDKITLRDYLRPERSRPKSQSPAAGAGKKSSSKNRGVTPPAPSTAAEPESAGLAQGAGGD